LVAIPFLFVRYISEDDIIGLLSVLAFIVGMVMVYTFSTLYHIAKPSRLKNILNKMDHISIFFLIAGTYTPLIIRYMDAQFSTIFLSVLWGIVLLGIFFKIFLINRLRWFSVALYLLMGWMFIFILKPMLANMPLSVMWWIVAGGISYSLGVYFYVKSSKPYFHTIWHLFVLAGTVFHFISIWIGIGS
jgi:hemolysin III